MLVALVIGAMAASVGVPTDPAGDATLKARTLSSLANYGVQLALVAAIWFALPREPQDGASAIPAPPRRARAFAAGLLAMAAAWPIVQCAGMLASIAQSALMGTEQPAAAHKTLDAMSSASPLEWRVLMGIVAVCLAPVAEEILYRGALQQALKGVGLARGWAIAATAALFAAAHWGSLVPGAEGGALAMLLVLGVAFGWAYERTGSLLAPVAAHAAFNAANLAIVAAWR